MALLSALAICGCGGTSGGSKSAATTLSVAAGSSTAAAAAAQSSKGPEATGSRSAKGVAGRKASLSSKGGSAGARVEQPAAGGTETQGGPAGGAVHEGRPTTHRRAGKHTHRKTPEIGSGQAGSTGSPEANPSTAAGAPSASAGTATFAVHTINMEPTYQPYATVIYNPQELTPGVGDVVVFKLPSGALEGSCGDNPPPQHACQEAAPGLSTTLALGRVVATSGDTVAFHEGDVILNGSARGESFTKPCGSGPVCTFPAPITVPAGSYYILNDDRSQLSDSRVWGAVPQAAIVGVAASS